MVDELRDEGTGLFNWALVQNRLEHALIRGARREQVSAVGLVHIQQTRFTDRIWPADWRRHIGAAMLQALRADDSVGVAPEGLFAMVLEDVASVTGAAEATKRVIIAIEQAQHDMGRASPTRAGLAVAVPPFRETNKLLLRAEVALVRAMSRAETTYVIFDEELDGPTFNQAQALEETTGADEAARDSPEQRR